MSTNPWDIYAEQLFPSGYGHPLWRPEPNPTSGREVFIGDVGWLVEGEFRALFNSMKDADDPVNQAKSVPRDFAAFPSTNLSIGRSDRINASIVFSRGITVDDAQAEATTDAPGGSPGWRFRTKSDAGAMVMLRPPAVAEDIESRRFVANYMPDHFDSWLEFANSSDSSWGGLGLRPEDVLFVCGTLKTTQWALATFQGSPFRNKDGVVSGQLDRSADVQFSVQIDGQPLPASHQRAGPAGRPSGVPDQCLFVRYYKMKRRLLGREPMQAAAGPHQLPPGPDNSGRDAMSPGWTPGATPYNGPTSSRDDTYDPVNHLLDYILQTSEADIAIASDLDLTTLFRDGTFPDDIPAALAELSPAVEIDEYGVGIISVDNSSAETDIQVGNAEPSTVRHADVSQKLPATSSTSYFLEASLDPQSESTSQNLTPPVQDTTYLPASPPGKLNDTLDGVDQEAASMLDEYAAALSESTTTGIWDVRHSTTRQELPLRNDAGHRAPVIAPRALPWHHLVMPVPLSVSA